MLFELAGSAKFLHFSLWGSIDPYPHLNDAPDDVFDTGNNRRGSAVRFVLLLTPVMGHLLPDDDDDNDNCHSEN